MMNAEAFDINAPGDADGRFRDRSSRLRKS